MILLAMGALAVGIATAAHLSQYLLHFKASHGDVGCTICSSAATGSTASSWATVVVPAQNVAAQCRVGSPALRSRLFCFIHASGHWGASAAFPSFAASTFWTALDADGGLLGFTGSGVVSSGSTGCAPCRSWSLLGSFEAWRPPARSYDSSLCTGSPSISWAVTSCRACGCTVCASAWSGAFLTSFPRRMRPPIRATSSSVDDVLGALRPQADGLWCKSAMDLLILLPTRVFWMRPAGCGGCAARLPRTLCRAASYVVSTTCCRDGRFSKGFEPVLEPWHEMMHGVAWSPQRTGCAPHRIT